MNPIEHLLYLLERCVRGRARVPQTVAELRQALNQEQRNIPQVNIRKVRKWAKIMSH